jgi:hypothetical protein
MMSPGEYSDVQPTCQSARIHPASSPTVWVLDREGDWLKHDHTDTSPRRPFLRRIHPGKCFRAPVVQVEV